MSTWDAIQGVLLVALVYGFCPGFVLRLVLLLYPKGDLRRAELLGELYALPRWKRPVWVAEQIETALFEGPSQRRADRRKRKAEKSRQTEAAREHLEKVEQARRDAERRRSGRTWEDVEGQTWDELESELWRDVQAGEMVATQVDDSGAEYVTVDGQPVQLKSSASAFGEATVSAGLYSRSDLTVGSSADSNLPRAHPRHHRAGEGEPTPED